MNREIINQPKAAEPFLDWLVIFHDMEASFAQDEDIKSFL